MVITPQKLMAVALCTNLSCAAAFAQDPTSVADQTPVSADENLAGSVSWALGPHLQNGLGYANRKAISPTVIFVNDSLTVVKDGYFTATQAVFDGFDMAYDSVSKAAVGVASFPFRTVGLFSESIHSGEFEKFLTLVYDSGFVLSEVDVGVELLPVLSVYFEHERSLSKEEQATVTQSIEDYISDEENSVGYAEAFILRSLMKAGAYSEDVDLKGVDISVFPLPGFTLTFDPVRNQIRNEMRIEESSVDSEKALELEKMLEGRLKRLEAEIALLNDAAEEPGQIQSPDVTPTTTAE